MNEIKSEFFLLPQRGCKPSHDLLSTSDRSLQLVPRARRKLYLDLVPLNEVVNRVYNCPIGIRERIKAKKWFDALSMSGQKLVFMTLEETQIIRSRGMLAGIKKEWEKGSLSYRQSHVLWMGMKELEIE